MKIEDYNFEKKGDVCPTCNKKMREDGVWYICDCCHGRLSKFCCDLRASLPKKLA